MGVGAYAAGIFHLYTHAFFKALLFLGSGAVIHALAGEQDLRRMGGLRKELADHLLDLRHRCSGDCRSPRPGRLLQQGRDPVPHVLRAVTTLLWAVGLLTSLLTAIYMFRLVYLAFHGQNRGAPSAHGAPGASGAHGAHVHDAPPAVAVALVLLAVGSVLAGYVGVPHAFGGSNRIEQFLEPSFTAARRAQAAEHDESAAATESLRAGRWPACPSSWLSPVSVLATYFFLKNRRAADGVSARFSGLHRLLEHKCYVDEIYDAAIVRPIRIVSEDGLWKGVDVRVIDGSVNGVGEGGGQGRGTVAPSAGPVRFGCTRRPCFSGLC